MPDPKPPVARKIRFMLLLPMLILGSCTQTPMMNDAIIQETKKCRDAGLKAAAFRDGWSMEIVTIQCTPNESEAK